MEIRGKAPLRISFAGGGTDLNEVFEKYGGAAINTTINKYIHMTLVSRKDKKILINGTEIIDEFSKRIIDKIKPKKGFEIYYHNDIPPRRGLGSSSTYSILFTKMIHEYLGIKLSNYDLTNKVYGIETDLGKCGWQDQYSVSVGGINFMEFKKDKIIVYPLRLKSEIIRELESYLILVFTKGEHNAKEIESRNVKTMTKKKASGLKSHAEQIRDCLLNGNIKPIGKIIHESWMLKRNNNTTNKEIDQIYQDGLDRGAEGGKLLGAGYGGYFLFFVNPQIRKDFITYFGQQGLEILIPELSERGVETWFP